ncbi:hypothetical protein LWI29_020858 [Acer saccharum]|uniref:Uncharacterized protein n=1 Tax=Acer saccharum TaxID=4024 RepID=A0AA39SFE7_ACESA|nr:hypothetical protein LWI29_020858 [Acer saccharum]
MNILPAAKRSAIASVDDPNKPTFGQATYDGLIAGKASGRLWKQSQKHRASVEKLEPPLKPTICSSASENGIDGGPPLKPTICSRMDDSVDEQRVARMGKAKKDFFEVGCMDKVRFVVLYGGEWIKSANRNESSIKMKFIFNSPKVLAPFEVVNDDDVQVFLCENSDVNTRTSLCVTVERKRRIIPTTQGPDNELVNEDIANVFESDNGNGVGLDNIHESLLSPNDFQNVDVFSIGVDNDDEARDSQPSTSEVPSRRSRVASSQAIGIKS